MSRQTSDMDERDTAVSIREQLFMQAEPAYADFAVGLLRKPDEEKPTGSAARVMGVRLPALRRMAAGLTKTDWRKNLDELRKTVEDGEAAFEEIMLCGFLIGKAPKAVSPEERFLLIREFVPHLDCWSLCDSFCASLKFTKEYPDEVWEFLQPYFKSEEEYSVRFGLVMLLNYFIREDYIDRLFPIFDSIRHTGYYVQMANAWAISICFVHFPDKTEQYLKQNQLDDFTYNKALQKITESRCVSGETKLLIRQMKR